MTRLRVIYVGNQLSGHGFTPTSIETLGERLKEDFDVIQTSSYKNMALRLMHMWWTVWRWRKADYLLIDTYSTSAFFFAWTCAKLASWVALRYIPILHGGDLPQRAAASPERVSKYLKRAFKVICPSPYLKEEMEKVIPLDYTIIPNAIELEDYSFELRSSLPSSSFKILWVRSFHKTYNPTLAIKVLKALHDKGYDQTELCMVGPDKDGSMKGIQTLARDLGVENKLKLTGRISKLDWLNLSTGFDVFMNTTQIDNTPVSVVEALALGLPVVTTNVGGIPHLLKSGTNALLVEPDNPQAFIDAFLSLQDDEYYEKLSRNGRVLAETFSWEKVSVKWNKILQ